MDLRFTASPPELDGCNYYYRRPDLLKKIPHFEYIAADKHQLEDPTRAYQPNPASYIATAIEAARITTQSLFSTQYHMLLMN